jgi:hypothetical protein
MTVSSTIRKAGPYTGTGLVTTYPFGFKVFATSDVLVVRTTNGLDTTLVLTSDYSVSLNSDQEASPGGNVVLVSALASGSTLTVGSQVPDLQPTDITNAGGFYPNVIEDALDRATIQTQQLAQTMSGAIQLPLSLGTTVDPVLPVPEPNALLGWNETATGLQNVDHRCLRHRAARYLHRRRRHHDLHAVGQPWRPGKPGR